MGLGHATGSAWKPQAPTTSLGRPGASSPHSPATDLHTPPTPPRSAQREKLRRQGEQAAAILSSTVGDYGNEDGEAEDRRGGGGGDALFDHLLGPGHRNQFFDPPPLLQHKDLEQRISIALSETETIFLLSVPCGCLTRHGWV